MSDARSRARARAPRLYGVRVVEGKGPTEYVRLDAAARAASQAQAGRRARVVVVRREFVGAPWREVPEAEVRGAQAAREGAF